MHSSSIIWKKQTSFEFTNKPKKIKAAVKSKKNNQPLSAKMQS